MEQVGVIAWTDIAIAAAATFTAGILLVAVVFAWREVHCIERAREAQLLADVSRRWDEELLRESRQAVEEYEDGTKLRQALEDLKKKNDKQYYVLLRLPDFFEELGLLVNKKCLHPQLAKDMFGTAIKYYYDRYKLTIKYLQEKYQDQTIYKFFSDLVTQVSD